MAYRTRVRHTYLASPGHRYQAINQACFNVSAAQSQLEQEMQQQQEQGLLLHGDTLAEFSRLEAEANAKTSKNKAALNTLATTQQVSRHILLSR